jgi:hypothetical protein
MGAGYANPDRRCRVRVSRGALEQAHRLQLMNQVKLGALCWNQYTNWPALLDAGVRADRLGYDSLWT